MERTIHVGQLEKLITSSKQYSEPWTFLSVLMSHDASPYPGHNGVSIIAEFVFAHRRGPAIIPIRGAQLARFITLTIFNIGSQNLLIRLV